LCTGCSNFEKSSTGECDYCGHDANAHVVQAVAPPVALPIAAPVTSTINRCTNCDCSAYVIPSSGSSASDCDYCGCSAAQHGFKVKVAVPAPVAPIVPAPVVKPVVTAPIARPPALVAGKCDKCDCMNFVQALSGSDCDYCGCGHNVHQVPGKVPMGVTTNGKCLKCDCAKYSVSASGSTCDYCGCSDVHHAKNAPAPVAKPAPAATPAKVKLFLRLCIDL
jgi:hypothetical protein